MLIEIIKFDDKELILRAGNTREECLESKPVMIHTYGIKDLYTLLLENRLAIELYLKSNDKVELIQYKFPDGVLPVTRL